MPNEKQFQVGNVFSCVYLGYFRPSCEVISHHADRVLVKVGYGQFRNFSYCRIENMQKIT